MEIVDDKKYVRKSKTIALIGASMKEERPSNSVMRNLLKRGYKVFPVNPGHEGSKVLGKGQKETT